jgi:hypothetical protein
MSSVPPGDATPATGSNATPISNGTPSQTPSQDPSLSTTSSSNSVSIPHGSSTVRITEKTFSTSSWDQITLDITKSNWQEWIHRTKLIVQRQGCTCWLNGTLKCPDESTNPDAYWVWLHNDEVLQGFLLNNILPVNLSLVCKLTTSHAHFFCPSGPP